MVFPDLLIGGGRDVRQSKTKFIVIKDSWPTPTPSTHLAPISAARLGANDGESNDIKTGCVGPLLWAEFRAATSLRRRPWWSDFGRTNGRCRRSAEAHFRAVLLPVMPLGGPCAAETEFTRSGEEAIFGHEPLVMCATRLRRPLRSARWVMSLPGHSSAGARSRIRSRF